ncbi:MAG: hypothetical protein AB1585_17670 [Thermodesulfobacteriota bacterium]
MKKVFSYILMFFVVLSLVTVVSVTQAADTLTGTWDLEVTSTSGKYNPTFILQQDDKEITGNNFFVGGSAAKIRGKIQGSDFQLTYKIGHIVIYKGKIEGDQISGSVDLGPNDKGTFTGVRKK